MRRYLVLSALGACLLVLASGPPALAGSSTHYAGKNSQGQSLRFNVDHTASGLEFDPRAIFQMIRCPVTGEVSTVGEVFRGFGTPIKNGKFNFALRGFSILLDWSGTVTSTGASGKESIDVAEYDKEGGLQGCGAGSLPWQAQAVTPGAAATAAPNATYIITFTKTPDGSVHYSITH